MNIGRVNLNISLYSFWPPVQVADKYRMDQLATKYKTILHSSTPQRVEYKARIHVLPTPSSHEILPIFFYYHQPSYYLSLRHSAYPLLDVPPNFSKLFSSPMVEISKKNASLISTPRFSRNFCDITSDMSESRPRSTIRASS